MNTRIPEHHDSTGISSLDEIMGGGLPRGSMVVILGVPGSGKTTLASQIAFTAAHAGKTVLILTALSESTTKLISHLSTFTFFDRSLIGGPVQFLSLQGSLPQGLAATGELIIAEARRVKADLVLLDGFRGMPNVDAVPQAARTFLYTVGTTLSALGITTLVTSEAEPHDPTIFPETTTADVILGLHYQLYGVRQFRGIEVIKARGGAPIPGLHTLALGTDGTHVYMQLEERIAANVLGGDAQTQGAANITEGTRLPPPPSLQRMRFDLPELDSILAGGIPRSTCTLLAGGLGTGKTLLALHYALAGVQAGESVVFLGFRESRDQLQQAADAFQIGSELSRALQPGGGLTFLEVPPIKVNADILADRLIEALDRTKAPRLIIDSIAGLERAILRSPDPNRLEDYLAALLQALRVRRVTALLIKETEKALAATLDFSADVLSVMAENVLLLQQLPYQGQLHRILSVLKMRFSSHDSSLREFRIAAPEGLQVLGTFESASGVLEGITLEQRGDTGQGQRSATEQAKRQTSTSAADDAPTRKGTAHE